MKKFIPLLLLASFSAFAEGPVEAMGVHLFSRHDPNRGENQYNPGLYVRFQHGITVGQYTNSLAKETTYAGWTTPEWYRMRMSFIAATGYKKKDPVIVPIPSIRLYSFDNGPDVWMSGTPVQITNSRAVGHLHIEWKFK